MTARWGWEYWSIGTALFLVCLVTDAAPNCKSGFGLVTAFFKSFLGLGPKGLEILYIYKTSQNHDCEVTGCRAPRWIHINLVLDLPWSWSWSSLDRNLSKFLSWSQCRWSWLYNAISSTFFPSLVGKRLQDTKIPLLEATTQHCGTSTHT